MSKRVLATGLTGLLLVVLAFATATAQSLQHYVEDFTSTEGLGWPLYADVDTIAGTATLPPFRMDIDGVENSYTTPGLAYDVAVSGNHAYVADHMTGGLLVLDVGSLGNPLSLLGALNTPGSAWDLELDGNRVYVADGSAGLLIVDVSDPTAPTPLGTFSTGGTVWGVSVAGDVAYVAVGGIGVVSVDVSDPAAPVQLGLLDTTGSAYAVDVEGDLLCVADGTAGLQLVDVTDPTAPALLGTYNSPDLAVDLDVAGDVVYLADRSGGLRIVDVRVPTSPLLLGSWSNGSRVEGLCHDLGRLYLAAGSDGLLRIDASDPTAPVLLDAILLDDVHGVCLDGEFAFVADETGLQVVDIFDPEVPCALDALAFNGDAGDLRIRDRYAYYDGTGGFAVFDVSDPENLSLVGSTFISADNNRFDLSGDYAYSAAPDGLRILDISDPVSPALLTTYALDDPPTDLAVRGDLVYVADSGYGLRILDIGNPVAPVQVGKIALAAYGTLHAVAVDGNTAFVAAGNELLVLDVTDRQAPVLIGSWHDTAAIAHIDLYGDWVLLSESTPAGGITMLDVSDPSTPDLELRYATPGSVSGVAVERECLWVFDSVAGPLKFHVTDGGLVVPVDGIDDADGAHAGALADGCLFFKDDTALRSIRYRQRDWASPRYLHFNTLYDVSTNPYNSLVRAVRLEPHYEGDAAPDRWWLMGMGAEPALITVNAWEIAGQGEWFGCYTALTERACTTAPVLTRLDVKLRFNAAVIDSIVDVPGDNGGWARLYFSRSGFDFPLDPVIVDQYYVWRRVDDPEFLARLVREGVEPTDGADLGLERLPGVVSTSRAAVLDGRLCVEGAADPAKLAEAMPPGTWEIVGSAPAHYVDQLVVLTSARTKLSAEDPPSVFCLTTEIDAGEWYCSWPDSGSAIDNLSPSVPTGLALSGGVLSWAEPVDPDFDYFTVYGSDVPELDPGAERIGYTTDTSFEAAWAGHLYLLVTATDYAGNQGPAAFIESATAVQEVPRSFRLLGASPNPFNPSTSIRFEMPCPSEVDVEVYDAVGRRIRVLARDTVFGAGRHAVAWDGRDEAGRAVSAGVFFYRVGTAGGDYVGRMTLVK